MIFLFDGKNGSLKSYHMVLRALKYYIKGITIYSNIKLNFNELHPVIVFLYRLKYRSFKNKLGQIIYFQDIYEIFHAKNCLIIFDEGQALFSSRSFEQMPRRFVNKLQQQRKDKIDFFTTTPNISRVLIDYRGLVQVWYHHTKIFALRDDPVWLGLYRVDRMDTDFLTETTNNHTQVPVEKSRFFWLHRFKKRLYDTNAKVAFNNYKIIWLSSKNKLKQKVLIIPVEMTIQQALRSITSLKLGSKPNKLSLS